MNKNEAKRKIQCKSECVRIFIFIVFNIEMFFSLLLMHFFPCRTFNFICQSLLRLSILFFHVFFFCFHFIIWNFVLRTWWQQRTNQIDCHLEWANVLHSIHFYYTDCQWVSRLLEFFSFYSFYSRTTKLTNEKKKKKIKEFSLKRIVKSFYCFIQYFSIQIRKRKEKKNAEDEPNNLWCLKAFYLWENAFDHDHHWCVAMTIDSCYTCSLSIFSLRHNFYISFCSASCRFLGKWRWFYFNSISFTHSFSVWLNHCA